MELLSKSAAKNSGFILIGKVIAAHGIRGALKVKSLSDFPERFLELEEVFLSTTEDVQNPQCMQVEDVQAQKGDQWLVWLDQIQDRNSAEALGKPFLCVPADQAFELPEDTFYVDDLIGYSAFSEEGTPLGEISQVIQGHQDLLELRTPDGKRHLVPFVKALVPEIQASERRLIIRLIEGLLDL
ncbi:16S rRNA processing protein RimM [bacterium (Candidatus Blackallbacteria) CG17_big_fil_post_rev_8_21_14_2_50_48_46]|uniref:Ribosome maturation factor RimM n=1 Tax=bacterium (Candidatus Blackallbacteria) CG17_big_fil_post_rev_8_21_14_2_50_48_46 TaxID=2014261 RepID=A0A2M7FX10_9BACT|nr:MAG: 16S rRNA processing protein RimM [bacterium (Candidatus Blackallbacteria) CG18_big_fil_WC_8_21_14_2_50_49_26]PIW13798.1 MAG: 16S rRNA processing protein RimM [bacterium (Candidatus Blackallbacteria) CG17_big_fil_post_rev_8_21_14_2_50_48_46]PIW45024.1 MAG: 16S rRNA processing protein RimM [bacterium (Candidatus Blackallbacteria) CG13_big_fil_rev_8_21_14_2_50_49_14]